MAIYMKRLLGFRREVADANGRALARSTCPFPSDTSQRNNNPNKHLLQDERAAVWAAREQHGQARIVVLVLAAGAATA